MDKINWFVEYLSGSIKIFKIKKKNYQYSSLFYGFLDSLMKN
jgi:hypothetical protein